jgi:putative membrane protein
MEKERDAKQMSPDEISIELSSRRTGMSFQRTRMSADRTLMSVIRTSLSLISFGFTIAQLFEKLKDQQWMHSAASTRHFGITLVALGIVMLIFGIYFHGRFMQGLRHLRNEMREENLIHGESEFPISMTWVTAVILLIIGVSAIYSMVYRVGPFG